MADKQWTHTDRIDDFINPYEQSWAHRAAVAMDNQGNAIIAWTKDRGEKYVIYISEYRNGIWNHPTGLEETTGPGPIGPIPPRPRVAMNKHGDAIVTWHERLRLGPSLLGSSQIFKMEFRDGKWSHTGQSMEAINPDNTDAWFPKVAMGDSGNASIVWQQEDHSGNRQFFMSELRDGSWRHPADLNEGIGYTGQASKYPWLAMNTHGDMILVWQSTGKVLGTGPRQFFSAYRNGTWHFPKGPDDSISLKGRLMGPWCDPSLAMDDDGNAIILWSENEGGYGGNRLLFSEYR